MFQLFGSIWLNRASTALATIYPKSNCKALYESHDHTLIKNVAGTLVYGIHEDTKNHYKFGKMPMEGLLPCFCQHEKEKDSKTYNNGKKNIEFKYMWNNENISYPICERYNKISFKAEAVNMVNSKAIAITNVLIRLYVINVLERTGFKTDTIMAFEI